MKRISDKKHRSFLNLSSLKNRNNCRMAGNYRNDCVRICFEPFQEMKREKSSSVYHRKENFGFELVHRTEISDIIHYFGKIGIFCDIVNKKCIIRGVLVTLEF